MITLFSLYEKFCGAYNTQQGGHVRPNRNFVDWVNDTSIELFEEYVAVAEKNQMIADYLKPFLVSVNVIVNPKPGSMHDEITLPKDYEHYSSARVFYDGNNKGCIDDISKPCIDGVTAEICESPFFDVDDQVILSKNSSGLCEVSITKIDNQRWGSICSHKTQGPTLVNPKITQYDQGLKIAPKNLGIIVLDYYRKPIDGTFLFTITNPGAIDEYIQFDPSSKPIEWSSVLINEFLNRMGKKYGKYVREQFIYEASAADNKTVI